MQTSSSSLLVPPPQGSGVVYVTGAGGFVGRHVVSAFRAAGWTVAGFGPRPRFDDVPGLLAPHWSEDGRLSLSGLQAAAAALGAPQAVVHAAGSGSVGASLADPLADLERNVGSLEPVLAFLRATAPQARLVMLSSAAVYGAGHPGPIPETAASSPVSPYGRHKLQAEELVLASGLDAICLRLFSVYGAGLRKQLLWDIARRLVTDAGPLVLDGTGREKRDFLAVDDAVRLIGLAATRPAAPPIVNGATGIASSVEQVARLAVAACGRTAPVVFTGQLRAGDPPSLYADIGAASRLGFRPATSLVDGVAAYLAWAKTVLGHTA
jgi:UDP-glucose 4-epimerase